MMKTIQLSLTPALYLDRDLHVFLKTRGGLTRTEVAAKQASRGLLCRGGGGGMEMIHYAFAS